MHPMFKALYELIKDPLRPNGGVKTDNSILLIYPPDKELDFREYLLDTFVPAIEAQRVAFRLLDLTGFPFDGMDEDTQLRLSAREFSNPTLMRQQLAQRTERALAKRIKEEALHAEGGTLIVWATCSVYPLVRLAEALRDLRDANARIVLAFPGEERGGRLHFMNQPDGGNYLTVKLFWR